MALQRIQHKLPDVLRETITSLCRNMVDFQDDLSIEGLLGVTLDSTQIFLVPIKERFSKGSPNKENGVRASSPVTIEDTPKKEKSDKKQRTKRRLEEIERENVDECETNNQIEEAPVNTEEKDSESYVGCDLPTDVSLDASLEIPLEFESNIAGDDDHDSDHEEAASSPTKATDVSVDKESPKDTSANQTTDGTNVDDTDTEKAQESHQINANPLEVLQNECEQLETNLKIASVWSDSPLAVEVKDQNLNNENTDEMSHDNEEIDTKESVDDQTPGDDLNISVAHGFEILEVDNASGNADNEQGPDDAVPSCSKDADVAETRNDGDENAPKKKRRRSASDDAQLASDDSSDSDDESGDRTKAKKKKTKSSPRGKTVDQETHVDSPQSTGSEIEFVAEEIESSTPKENAKKKRRKSKDNEDLIILDDNDSRGGTKKKKKEKEVDIHAMIAGVVKSTMGKLNIDGSKASRIVSSSPLRALGTITPVMQSKKAVPMMPQQQLTCQFCGQKFNNLRLLNQHRQMDKCNICGGLFNCPTLRFNHVVRDHQGMAGASVPPLRGGIPRGRGQRGGLTPFSMSSMSAQAVRQATSQMGVSNFMAAAPSTSTSANPGGKNFRVVTAKKCRDCGGLYSVNDFERHQSECPAVTSQKKKKHMCGCGIGYRQAKNYNAHIEQCTIAQALGMTKIND